MDKENHVRVVRFANSFFEAGYIDEWHYEFVKDDEK
jgi:hypothetical protein